MSFCKTFVAVLLAALMLCATGCSFYDKLQARGELNRGVACFRDQKYTDAIKFFKGAIALDPAFIEPYSYLATSYAAMYVPGSQDPNNVQYAKDAISGFETVLRKNPNNANAMIYIAQLYYQLKQYDNSTEWCRKIISKEPKNYEALYRIGVIDYDVSIDATGLAGEKVSDITPTEKTEVLRHIAKGIKALDDAIIIKPDYFEAMHYLNLLYREQAKFAAIDTEKNRILLKADTVALKAMDLEKAAKAAQDTRILNLKKQ